MLTTDNWEPQYESWRHGGWYVTNVHYPSGAVGCVSRNYPDKKWRIACDERGHHLTYANRDAAARAERALAASFVGAKLDSEAKMSGRESLPASVTNRKLLAQKQ